MGLPSMSIITSSGRLTAAVEKLAAEVDRVSQAVPVYEGGATQGRENHPDPSDPPAERAP